MRSNALSGTLPVSYSYMPLSVRSPGTASGLKLFQQCGTRLLSAQQLLPEKGDQHLLSPSTACHASCLCAARPSARALAHTRSVHKLSGAADPCCVQHFDVGANNLTGGLSVINSMVAALEFRLDFNRCAGLAWHTRTAGLQVSQQCC